MRTSAIWLRGIAYGFIGGARQQLILEHRVRLRDLLPLVAQSSLVPDGHEGLFARGFLAGFHGDFVTAFHILVPQLENGLRVFVERELGKVLIRQKDDGTQMAGLLGRVLGVPELESVLREDIIFDLRGLLIEQDSVNLRNNLAHGLIPDRGFGIEAFYFWWLLSSDRVPDDAPGRDRQRVDGRVRSRRARRRHWHTRSPERLC